MICHNKGCDRGETNIVAYVYPDWEGGDLAQQIAENFCLKFNSQTALTNVEKQLLADDIQLNLAKNIDPEIMEEVRNYVQL